MKQLNIEKLRHFIAALDATNESFCFARIPNHFENIDFVMGFIFVENNTFFSLFSSCNTIIQHIQPRTQQSEWN